MSFAATLFSSPEGAASVGLTTGPAQLWCIDVAVAFPTLAASLLAAFLAASTLKILGSRGKEHSGLSPPPPGPRPLPVLGNLLNVGSAPHVSLADLATKYGPVMRVYFGHFPAVVLSSPEVSALGLKIL